jgi:tetratricopeptide (TPR) repeat protein
LPQRVTIALDVLEPEDARSLLAALEEQGRVAREPETADQLCAALGYLPLGIELVGCYLRRDRYRTLSQIIASLQAKGMQDPALARSAEDEMLAERGVKAAFDLTWETLEPAAQQVARLLSYFALDWMEWDLVEWVMQRVEGDEYELGGLKARLENASLVQFERDRLGWCRLHPLIRQYVQAIEQDIVAAAGEAPLRSAFVEGMIAIARKMPQDPTTKDVNGFEGARSHVQEVAECHTAGLEGNDLVWSFVALARFHEGQGLYRQAEDWSTACLRLTQSRFVGDHPTVASSLNNLAGLYDAQGRLSEAEPLLRQALEMSQRLFAGDHPDVASSLNNLAYLYNEQGRWSEAEPLYGQALEMRQRLFAGDHPDVASSLNNLAALYDSQGRWSEAEPLYGQALEMRQRLFAGDHPDVASSLNNLAYLYYSQGRWSEAEPLYGQALEMRQRLFAGDHPDVALSLNNLAYLYQAQGRWREAEPLYGQALEMSQRLFAGDHPAVALSLNNLAYLYQAQGRWSEAEPLYGQALEMRQRLFAGDHPAVALSLNNLGAFYSEQGRGAEAEPLLVQALAMWEKILGADHPNTVVTRQWLAFVRQGMSGVSPARRPAPLILRVLRQLWSWLRKILRRLVDQSDGEGRSR